MISQFLDDLTIIRPQQRNTMLKEEK